MKNFINSFRYYITATFLLPFIILSLISRVVLLSYALEQKQLVLNAEIFVKIFGYGLINDLATYIFIISPLLIIVLIVPQTIRRYFIFKLVTHLWHLVWIGVLCFLIVAEFLFWDEFGTRFNFIAVDYLVYTHEVIGNIVESYPIGKLLIAIALISLVILYFYRHIINNNLDTTHTHNYWKHRFMIAAVLSAFSLANYFFYTPNYWYIKQNRFAHELSLNGLYSLFSAYLNNSIDYNNFYQTIPNSESFSIVKKAIASDKNSYITPNTYSIEREIKYPGSAKPYNVILLMVESLSYSFLNDEDTPNLMSFKKQSIFFNNLYATGTRTVRGLEAATLSVPPTPGISIVRRPNNENLFSIASVLKKYSYDLKFIYGGHGYFDNMNYFFTNNGFKKIDRSDIPKEKITFANVWGISDQDLYSRVIEEADQSYQNKRNFFSFIMTTSNHRPFTYPDNTVSVPSGQSRKGAVQYTDYAINKFLKEAKSKPWFDNTIFVIVADHCASSAGKTNIDINKYIIPMFIYAPKLIKPQLITKPISQIDIAPTILGLLNISYKSKFYGKDVLRDQSDSNILLGTNQLLAYLNHDNLVILSTGKSADFYKVKGNELVTTSESNSYLKTAISFYQSAYYLFFNGLMKQDN